MKKALYVLAITFAISAAIYGLHGVQEPALMCAS